MRKCARKAGPSRRLKEGGLERSVMEINADVTPVLSRQVHGGILRSAVTNDALGGDPAFRHVKRLCLDYTIDGKPNSVVLQENDRTNISCGDALPGPWRVDFPDQTLRLNTLISWTQRPEPKIKYYSDTATYHTKFEASDIGNHVLIDLGHVHAIAEITSNARTIPVCGCTRTKPMSRPRYGPA